MRNFVLGVCATALFLSGCASAPTFSGPTAVADIKPVDAGKATGTVTFMQQDNLIVVRANIQGLGPDTEHGFHIHDVSACSSVGMRTSPHFNPDGNPHSHPGQPQRHAGAMFNLKADSNGNAYFEQVMDTITLADGKYGVIGKAVVVHARRDDYRSQPSGNAGMPIGCGIIAKK